MLNDGRSDHVMTIPTVIKGGSTRGWKNNDVRVEGVRFVIKRKERASW